MSDASASSAVPAGARAEPQVASKRSRGDRLLPWIAAERTLRAIVLLAVGIALIANPDHDWGKTISHLTRDLGLNPSSNGIEKIIHKLHAISSQRFAVFGVIAIAYGMLEAVEGYGLWRRRPWAEYLTVFATSVLFVPEIWELAHKVTVLKLAALLVNVAVVVYLVARLRSRRTPEAGSRG
jgi:uncharacterized membrane protein (DUF2068 family)